MTAPGYALPTVTEPADFEVFDIGRRMGAGVGSKISWRPIGTYIEAGISPTFGLEPGKFAFELPARNPLNDQIAQADVDKNIYQFRAQFQGIPFSGRIMQRKQSGAPGREKFIYSGVCHKIWLQRGYGWVNNFFPPEIQIGLTGKQDVRFGPYDPVMKSYVSSVFTRLNKPVWPALPIKWTAGWSQPEMVNIFNLNALLDILFGAADNLGIIGLMSRFTQLDELFAPSAERLEIGFKVDLWDGHGTSPQVLCTTGLGALQSIVDHNGDNFLNLSKLLLPINNGLFSLNADRAGYIFDTVQKRDNRKVMFRTDGTQIRSYDLTVTAPDAVRSIVGGKSPSLVNELIEIGANLILSLIIAAINAATAGALGSLLLSVGDLFDDIFFAYEVHADNDLENELGDDDALPEIFGDNTAAYSIDGYAVGKTVLHEHAGGKTLEIDADGGSPGGRGISWGADDGTARRYQVGDVLSFWDRGNVVEKHVTGVAITSKPGERMRQKVTLGDDKRAKGPMTRMIKGIQGLGATSRGIANST